MSISITMSISNSIFIGLSICISIIISNGIVIQYQYYMQPFELLSGTFESSKPLEEILKMSQAGGEAQRNEEAEQQEAPLEAQQNEEAPLEAQQPASSSEQNKKQVDEKEAYEVSDDGSWEPISANGTGFSKKEIMKIAEWFKTKVGSDEWRAMQHNVFGHESTRTIDSSVWGYNPKGDPTRPLRQLRTNKKTKTTKRSKTIQTKKTRETTKSTQIQKTNTKIQKRSGGTRLVGQWPFCGCRFDTWLCYGGGN